MKQWNVVITGFGTVGKQAARLLAQRQGYYREKYDADVRLVGAVRSTSGLYDVNGLGEEALLEWELLGKEGTAPSLGANSSRLVTRISSLKPARPI